MSKKQAILNEINEMNKIIKSMPKLNETLSFGGEPLKREEKDDDFDIEGTNDDITIDDTFTNSKPNSDASIDNKHKTLVDKIRRMALEGMSELAEHTDDPNYDILKKIWQFCDKKVDDTKKSAENSLPM